jgi:hypothetical protein
MPFILRPLAPGPGEPPKDAQGRRNAAKGECGRAC